MKKKILLFLSVFLFIILATSKISASANETVEYGLRRIEMGQKYNYLVFANEQEQLDKTNFIRYYDGVFEDTCYNEDFIYYVELINSQGTSYTMKCVYTFQQEFLAIVEYFLNDVVVYSADYFGSELNNVRTINTIVVEEYTGIEDDYFLVNDCYFVEQMTFDISIPKMISLACCLGNLYLKNVQYKGNDVYFLSQINNPITIDEIKAHLSARDSTDGDITENIEIYNNTYIVDENLSLGKYSFDAYVHDYYGNTTYQKCYVMVVDLEAPVIVGQDIEVSSESFLSKDKLLKQFTATDNNGQCTIEIIENNYTANYNSIGTYTVTAKATDEDGNSSTATINVNVVDLTPPVATVFISDITISSLDDYSEEDLISFFKISDKIDGDNVTVWLEDLDGYFLNTRKSGEYMFYLYAADTSNNKMQRTFRLYVVDEDFPTIEVDSTFSIIISSDDVLTKEQIIAYFNALPNIDQQVVEVSSEYFSAENKEGEYNLELTMDDGSIVESKIIIKAKENNYSPKEDNGFSVMYVGIGIIGLMIIAVGCLSIVRLKKKR